MIDKSVLMYLILMSIAAIAGLANSELPVDKTDISPFIVGGEAAEIKDIPYQAALLYFGMIYCGGCIVSSKAVVSAAHCVVGRDPSVLTVRVGSSLNNEGGQEVSLSRAIYNKNFKPKDMDFDVSLLFLSEKLNLNEATINVIPFASSDYFMADGSLAVTSGWGSLQEGGVFVARLRKVTIPSVNLEECKRIFSNVGVLVTDRMLCAGGDGKDACQGDSGGPLVNNGTLVGITSWGMGCGRRDYPGVWTSVTAVSDWINDQLQLATVMCETDLESCPCSSGICAD